jgi:predicted MFS family arabinose efflux permease
MSEISNQAAQAASDTAMAKIATSMTVGGGSTAFIGGLTLNEFAMVFGMIVGLLGLCLQAYQTLHKRRVYIAEHQAIQEKSRREEEEHRAKMEMYQ